MVTFLIGTASAQGVRTMPEICLCMALDFGLRSQKTGVKKPALKGWFLGVIWSAREDLNLRPPTPHDGLTSYISGA